MKDVDDVAGCGWGAALWKKKDYNTGGGWGASPWKKEDDDVGGSGWTKEADDSAGGVSGDCWLEEEVGRPFYYNLEGSALLICFEQYASSVCL